MARRPIGERAMTGAERQRRLRESRRKAVQENSSTDTPPAAVNGTKRRAGMKVVLRIRTYPDYRGHVPVADVWLIERGDKGDDHCLMHGQCSPQRAERLAEALGVAVERERR